MIVVHIHVVDILSNKLRLILVVNKILGFLSLFLLVKRESRPSNKFHSDDFPEKLQTTKISFFFLYMRAISFIRLRLIGNVIFFFFDLLSNTISPFKTQLLLLR